MKCPRCSSALSTETRESVSIEICSACKGLWTGTEQIKTMIKNHDTTFSPTLIQKTIFESGPKFPVEEQKNLAPCPLCAKDMHVLNYNYSSGVFVNVCSSGHGIWFDSGELERVEIFMEHWDQQKELHKAEYLGSMKAASLEEDSIIAAIDARIMKDISPWGFLGAVLHTFKTKKVS